MNTTTLFPDLVPEGEDSSVAHDVPATTEPPRLRVPNREQTLLVPVDIDALLPADHPARLVWALVQQWDLSKLLEAVRARGSEPGRATADPRLLVALWLYAATQNVAQGRELDRLCLRHDAYRWLCGGVSVNYHTLNDFRVAHEEVLDDLLTQMLAVLTRSKVVRLERIVQDGTRVRAGAGARSFKRRDKLAEHLAAAQAHVQALKALADDPAQSAQQRAARARAAREQVQRLEGALHELAKVEQAKAQQKHKPTTANPPRASTTDAEARFMRMPDGGSRPAYNVQFACDPHSRAIVGVDVTNAGSDANESEPMRRQVQGRTGQAVREQVLDGGYVNLAAIDRAAAEQVRLIMPVPQPRKEGVDPHAAKVSDSPAVGDWRHDMGTAEAKAIFKQRAATIETVHAETKTYRGLKAVLVRGLHKVRCLALWSALAYNVVHFASALLEG